MRGKLAAAMAGTLLAAGVASAQQRLDAGTVAEALDTEGRFVLPGGSVVVLAYDYAVGGDNVEAIAFRPSAEGRYPAVLLIPGFSRTARDYIPLGIRLAKEGFASVAVTQRGFGKSAGEPDFAGPRTIAALEAGLLKFRREPYVDAARVAVFGYSRGAMAASLLAVRESASDLKAAIFAAGIYDFRKAHDEIGLAGIRENMEHEAGLTEEAVRERTSLTKMAALPCPVLILHGEKDDNAPVDQAYLLRDELTRLNKPFELKTFPDRDHDLGRQNLYDSVIPFLQAKLAAPSP